MSIIKSGNANHDATALAAEVTRQVAVTLTSTGAATRTAEIAFYRSLRASAIKNGLCAHQFTVALQELGTGGV